MVYNGFMTTLTPEQWQALNAAARYFHAAEATPDNTIIEPPGAHVATFTAHTAKGPLQVTLDLFWHRLVGWDVRFGYSEEFNTVAVSDVMRSEEFNAKYSGKFEADSDL